MGDWLSENKWHLSLEQFQGFYEARPEFEKWELIAGVPVMMPPPRIVHQRIAGNLDHALRAACRAQGSSWLPDREIGIVVPAEENWNPEPDVTVIDAKIAPGQIYAERFYMVAEVLSPNDKPAVLTAKRNWYKAHQHCLAVMFIEQETIAMNLEVRASAAADWEARMLTNRDDAIELPTLGVIGQLADLYANTPLLS